MGLISPGGQNLLDFLELRQVLSTYDGALRDPLWWPQALDNTCMNVRTFACGNMDAHTRTAKNQSTLEISFGDLSAYAQPDSVKHQIGVNVRITVRSNTKIRDLPPFSAQMRTDRFFKRITRKIRTDY